MSVSSSQLGDLGKKTKDQLIELIKNLSNENAALFNENSVLKEIQSHIETTDKRLEKLEREQNKHLQYTRRNSIEVTGIPTTVRHTDLEGEILKIYNAAEVSVHGKNLNVSDIQACHRIGKKGVTICMFVNRKFAKEGLYCGKNLRGKNLYDQGTNIYINNSFCDEFRYLNYLVRKAKSEGRIFRWKVKNGVNFIQKEEDDESFIEISHKNDLISSNLLQESE